MKYYLLRDGKIIAAYATMQPGKDLAYLEDAPDSESRWNGIAWVPDTEKIAIREAEEARLAAKAKAFSDNLPSWKTVSDAIDAATTLAQLKTIVKKIALVVYWDIKDGPE